MTNPAQPPDVGAIGEVEALCAMADMLALYRETVAEAARCIACGLADPGDLSLPVTDPRP